MPSGISSKPSSACQSRESRGGVVLEKAICQKSGSPWWGDRVLSALYSASVSLALSRSYCLFEFSCIRFDGSYFVVAIDDVDSLALIVSIGFIGNGCGCNSDMCIRIDCRSQSAINIP